MSSASTIRIGQRLTDYTSVDLEVRQVGRGGFGLVAIGPDHLAEDRWYAAKTLRPEVLARVPRARDLFVRESLIWIGLWPHANLLTAQTVTLIDEQPYLVLDFAERGSLRDLLQRRPQLPLDVGMLWAQMAAAGLVALHTPDPAWLRPQPLVHRDLKPENILMHADGRAVITDFGLAKAIEQAAEDGDASTAPGDLLAATAGGPAAPETASQALRTGSGVALGTPAYMAPELWHDAASAGPPADVYALGLILSEVLAGRHALLDLGAGHGRDGWERAHRAGRRRPLGERAPGALPPEVEAAYAACLEPEPERRPSANEVLAMLRAAAAALGRQPYTVPEGYAHTPDHERIKWHNWAAAYFDFGLNDEALERNRRALALDPRNARLLLTQGNILYKLGRSDEALVTYDAALAAIPPEDRVGRHALLYNRGAVLNETGRFAEAEASYAAALALVPDAATAWGNRANNELWWGRAELREGHDAEARTHFTRAIRHGEEAVRLDPSHRNNQRILSESRLELARLGG